jgi:thiamine transport system ATP-binding protein
MTLDLTDVTVRFGAKTAVDAVSLSVPTGEVFALLGPSGSGKSSLLRAIAGLEPCTGDIAWDGESVVRVPPHRRGFALMFQDGQLFPHLDVAGNVGYALRVAGRPSGERVAELLELVGLSGFEKRGVTDLSGGEQQRVALARSLAASPRLLLLDEPLSSLDRELRERLAVEVRGILKASGTTAILVTHDHDEAGVIADRTGLLVDGRLASVG